MLNYSCPRLHYGLTFDQIFRLFHVVTDFLSSANPSITVLLCPLKRSHKNVT